MSAMVITTDGDVKPAPVPASDTLHWLYEQIGCSTVDVLGLPHDQDMWVDDEGLINDSPVNVLATLWARYFGGLDVVIYGNVVLAKHDGQGATVDLDEREEMATMLTLLRIVDMAAEAMGDGPGKDESGQVVLASSYSLN
jgi:hypothetical protein